MAQGQRVSRSGLAALDPSSETPFVWRRTFRSSEAPLFTRRKILACVLIGLIPLAACAAPRIIEGGLFPYAPIGTTELEPNGRVWIPITGQITGGQSGILAIDGGAGFWMISDRGTLTRACAERDGDGHLEAVTFEAEYDLRLSHPDAYVAQLTNDAEDLAYGTDGKVYVSFEGYGRLAQIQSDNTTRHNLIDPEAFVRAQGNRLFEAMAPLPDGSFLVFPEERPRDLELFELGAGPSPEETIPVVQVHAKNIQPNGFARLSSAGWLPISDGWAVASADTAEDGAVWILERSINLTGFSSRIRRFPVTDQGLPNWENGQVMIETRPGDLGNMEGLTLWRPSADAPQHITLISDNDNSSFRTTLVAEYIWRDQP